MLELILLLSPVCQPGYWGKVYLTYYKTLEENLLQNGVNNTRVNFTPKMVLVVLYLSVYFVFEVKSTV